MLNEANTWNLRVKNIVKNFLSGQSVGGSKGKGGRRRKVLLTRRTRKRKRLISVQYQSKSVKKASPRYVRTINFSSSAKLIPPPPPPIHVLTNCQLKSASRRNSCLSFEFLWEVNLFLETSLISNRTRHLNRWNARVFCHFALLPRLH